MTAAGQLARDGAGRPIPDAAGRLIFDDGRLADAVADVWWIFRYSYALAGVAGDPVPLWAHFTRGPDARFARADGTVGAAAWQEEDMGGQWTFVLGGWRRAGPGGGQLRDGAPGTWEQLRVAASVEPPPAAGAEIGILARYAPGADTGYRLRLRTPPGAQALDMVLERLDAGAVTELARRDNIATPAGEPHVLSLECRDDGVHGTLDGAVAIAAVDPGAHLGAGDVGLWASGDGAVFRDLVLTDLAGRP